MNKSNDVMARPVNGRRLRKPDGTLLAKDGERVQKNSYWLRREKDGDVTLSPIGAATKAPINKSEEKPKA